MLATSLRNLSNLLTHGTPRLYARDADNCLECRYTQINFANLRDATACVRNIADTHTVVSRMRGCTIARHYRKEINDLLPARKLTTFLLSQLFFPPHPQIT